MEFFSPSLTPKGFIYSFCFLWLLVVGLSRANHNQGFLIPFISITITTIIIFFGFWMVTHRIGERPVDSSARYEKVDDECNIELVLEGPPCIHVHLKPLSAGIFISHFVLYKYKLFHGILTSYHPEIWLGVLSNKKLMLYLIQCLPHFYELLLSYTLSAILLM